SRTWFRQNPPISRVRWSLRNNNNYEMTGLLVSLNYVANNRIYFLRNFYDKSKRSILKAKTEGPAAYVFPANDLRPGSQAELLRVLQKQAVEISRAPAAFSVTMPGRRPAGAGAGRGGRGGGGGNAPAGHAPGEDTAGAPARPAAAAPAMRQVKRRRRRRRHPRRRRGNFRPAARSCAWTSPTRASPTRSSTTS